MQENAFNKCKQNTNKTQKHNVYIIKLQINIKTTFSNTYIFQEQ